MEKEPCILIYGTGVIGGGIAKILAKDSKVLLFNRDSAKAENLAKEAGAVAMQNKEEALSEADVVLLAVKPQDFASTALELRGKIRNTQALISVLLGINLETLQTHLGTTRVIRAMLNLPSLYGKGVIGLATPESAVEEDKQKAEWIFKKMGQVFWLTESKLDALTAIAGSGPAFVLIFYEAMVDAALALGIPLELAKKIVEETLAGSAELIKQSKAHPGELRWQISSPGGCTIAGTKQLEDESFRSAVINIFLATHDRIRDFSGQH